jgi:hypothetical protein
LTAEHQYDISNNKWNFTLEDNRGANLEMVKIGMDSIGGLQKPTTRMHVWVPSLKKGFALGGNSYLDSPKKTSMDTYASK